jgi:hypothetical protein
MDHDPPLRAESPSGQHLYDLPQIRWDIAHREELLRISDEVAEKGGWYRLNNDRDNSINFFEDHRTCNLGIRDQYGEWHAITEEEETAADEDARLLHRRGFFERWKRWLGLVGR